jgi:hypothetical protein
MNIGILYSIISVNVTFVVASDDDNWRVVAQRRLNRLKLFLRELCEHAVWINRDEQTLTARQHFPIFVQDLGHIDVLPARYPDLARFHTQQLFQWHRFQVIHRNLGGQRHHLVQFVHLAHRFIENSRDDATVAVSWRSSVALAQTEPAHETLALLVIGEAQPHAISIVRTAGEAVIFL